jgi:acyl carrier protein
VKLVYFCTPNYFKNTMNKETLIEQLKVQIIEVLNLDGVSGSDIDADAPLFVEGLGLDSIDALELIVLLEKEYGIKIENSADARKIFSSVSNIAQYILDNKKD